MTIISDVYGSAATVECRIASLATLYSWAPLTASVEVSVMAPGAIVFNCLPPKETKLVAPRLASLFKNLNSLLGSTASGVPIART